MEPIGGGPASVPFGDAVTALLDVLDVPPRPRKELLKSGIIPPLLPLWKWPATGTRLNPGAKVTFLFQPFYYLLRPPTGRRSQVV